MAKTLAKGARITGAQRGTLATTFAKRYESGMSIRKIAADCGRSYGFVHGVLKEAEVDLRGRGGATGGPRRGAKSAAKRSTTKKAALKTVANSSAGKTPAAQRSPTTLTAATSSTP
jgi:hypothetical protein